MAPFFMPEQCASVYTTIDALVGRLKKPNLSSSLDGSTAALKVI